LTIFVVAWHDVQVPESSKRTYGETIAHYRELRRLCYEDTERQFSNLAVKVSGITPADIVEGDSWSRDWTGDKIPIWEWSAMYRAYCSGPNVKGLDLAVRCGGRLQVLCLGVPSRRKLILKLHALDRAPIDNPLAGQAFRIVLFAASTYAILLGSEELWLMQPQSDGAARYYGRFGFVPHRTTTGVLTHMTQKIR
jgi:hypothetical protein